MKKLFLAIAVFATLASAAFGDAYRVSYTYRGLIQRITVEAEPLGSLISLGRPN